MSKELIINNKDLDRRFKLSEEQKESIKKEWNPDCKKGSNQASNGSIHYLASKYEVSRRTISMIVKPNEGVQPIKYTYEEKKDFNSSTKMYRRIKIQEHREYKRKLLKENKIKKAGK